MRSALSTRGATAPETEIQQPHAAHDRNRAEHSRHARHDAGRRFAVAVIHYVEHPLEVVPAPKSMTPCDERPGIGMQIERCLQPVVEVHAPYGWGSTAHFHRNFVFEQRHRTQLTAA